MVTTSDMLYGLRDFAIPRNALVLLDIVIGKQYGQYEHILEQNKILLNTFGKSVFEGQLYLIEIWINFE